MKGQLQRLGISYAWEREIATCLPEYYHWNQWLFLKMLERDLAYPQALERQLVPELQDRARQRAGRRRRLLALRHDRHDSASWSSGSSASRAYADELLEAADGLTEWPEKVLTMQRNWIGRSEGARVTFPIVGVDGAATDEAHRGLHDAHRHHLRRDLRRCSRPSTRSSSASRPSQPDPAALPRRGRSASARRIAPRA